MPIVEIPGVGDVEFPDTMSDDEIAAAIRKQQVASPSAGITQSGPIKQGPRTMAQQLGWGETMAEPVLDFLQGVGSGAAKTVVNIGDLVNMSQGLRPLSSSPEVRVATATPPSPAGQAGEFVEQAAEYFIPGPPITKGTGLIKGAMAGRRGAGTVNLLGRAGLEAGGAGLVAGAQTGGDPRAMAQAALTAGAVTPVAAAVTAGTKGYLSGAQKQYEKVLHPSKEKWKYLAHEKVVPELLKRRQIVTSLEGLEEHAIGKFQKFGQDLETAWKALPPDAALDAPTVLKLMDDEVKDLYTTTARGVVTKGPEADIAIAHMDDLKKVVWEHSEWNQATGKWEIPAHRARDLRQHFDTVAEKAGSFHGKTLAEANKASAYTIAGNVIRGELAKDFPDIAKINKEYSFWRNVADVTEATIQRRVGQAPSLSRRVAQGAGAVIGAGLGMTKGQGGIMAGVGAGFMGGKAMQTLEEAVTSPLWRTVSATTKDRIAQSIVRGRWPEVEFYLRRAGIGMLAPKGKEETAAQ